MTGSERKAWVSFITAPGHRENTKCSVRNSEQVLSDKRCLCACPLWVRPGSVNRSTTDISTNYLIARDGLVNLEDISWPCLWSLPHSKWWKSTKAPRACQMYSGKLVRFTGSQSTVLLPSILTQSKGCQQYQSNSRHWLHSNPKQVASLHSSSPSQTCPKQDPSHYEIRSLQ